MSLATYAPRRSGAPAPAEEDRAAGRPAPGQPAFGGPRRAGRRTRRALWPAADVLAVALAAVITGTGLVRGACYGVLVLIALTAGGCHRPSICLRVTDQLGRLGVAAALPALALAPWVSAVRAVELAVCTAGLLVSLRAAAAAALRTAYRHGLLVQQTLIIGAGPAGRHVAGLIADHPELGLAVAGVLDDQPESRWRSGQGGQPLAGRTGDAGSLVAASGAGQVLVCNPAAADTDVVEAVRDCRSHGAQVAVLPRLPELGLAVPRARLDEIWGVPLIPVRPDPQAIARRVAKRVTDLALGTAMVILTAPLVLVLAAAVRWDLRLPVLFRQDRVVGPGRRATITKLRTLRPRGDPDTAWQVRAGQCSALGRLLRGTHADELPQLASVLKGHMSLVGPRPERPHFARQLAAEIPGYADRERAIAGLTGWAQVHGLSGDTSISDRARFDNFYIEYWSIWLDLLILARTGPAALSGAFRSARGGSS